jgi:hypothetical protein
VADLERELARLRVEVARSRERDARLALPPSIRWAKTAVGEGESYPEATDEPNTYPFVLVDAAGPEAAGQQSVTTTPRQSEARELVTNLADGRTTIGIYHYLPLGTLIPVWRTGGRWWTFWQTSNIFPVTLAGSVAAGASTSVTLPDGRSVVATNQTGGTLSTRATVYQNADNKQWYLTGARSGELEGEWDFYYAFLSSPLQPNDGIANLTGVVHLEDGSTPLIPYADNLFGWRGNTGTVALIMRAAQTVTGYLLIVLQPHQWRRYKGTLYSTLSTDDATATVTDVVALDGSGAILGNLSVRNDAHLSGKSGYFVEFDEDLSNLEGGVQYILALVRHYKVEPITDERYSTSDHEFQFKRTPITAMWEADEDDDWTGYHTAVEETVVTEVLLADNTLAYIEATAWMLEPLSGSVENDVLEFENITYLETVAVDSGVLKQTYRNAMAINVGGATTETVFTPTLQRVVEKVEDIGVALVQTYVDVYVWRVDEGFTESISPIDPCTEGGGG